MVFFLLGAGEGREVQFCVYPNFDAGTASVYTKLQAIAGSMFDTDCSMLSINILFLSLLAHHQSHDVLAQGTASTDAECERGKLLKI